MVMIVSCDLREPPGTMDIIIVTGGRHAGQERRNHFGLGLWSSRRKVSRQRHREPALEPTPNWSAQGVEGHSEGSVTDYRRILQCHRTQTQWHSKLPHSYNNIDCSFIVRSMNTINLEVFFKFLYLQWSLFDLKNQSLTAAVLRVYHCYGTRCNRFSRRVVDEVRPAGQRQGLLERQKKLLLGG